MKHYKDPTTNELYAYNADGSQDNYIKPGLVEISNNEAETIRSMNISTLINSLPYTEKRRLEYPPMADYIDGIVKGDQAQVQAYIDACLAVKNKYPKE